MFNKMRRGFFNLAIFLVTIFQLTAEQNQNGLATKSNESDGEEKIRSLHALSNQLRWSYPDQAITYAKESLEIAKSIGDSALISQSFLRIGGAHYYQGNYDSTLLLTNRSLEIAQAIQDSSLIVTNYNTLGLANFDLGDFQTSMEYYLKGLDILNRLDNKTLEGLILNNISLVYEKLNEISQSRAYSLLGLNASKRDNNKNFQVYSYNCLGITYLKEGQFDIAHQYLDSASVLATSLENKIWGAVTFSNIGELYRLNNEYDSAFKYLDISRQRSQEIGDKKRVAEVYSALSKLYLDIGQLGKAKECLDFSQELAKDYGWLLLLQDNLLQYTKVYRAMNAPEKVLKSQTTYLELKDSVSGDVLSKNLLLLPLKLKEQSDRIKISEQASELKIQGIYNGIYLFIIAVAVPVLILLIVLLRRNKKQNAELVSKNEEIRKTQKLLVRTEKMASLGTLAAGIGHEINNPLNYISNGVRSISTLVKEGRTKDNPEELKKYFEIVDEGVKRASNIVHSLTNFSRAGIDQEEQCKVESIIENCLLILSSQTKNITIKKNFPRRRGLVNGNESKLNQAFMNVIINAIHAVEEEKEGEISITTKYSKKEVSISIKDNGVGISDRDISRISDPFFTTKAPGEGTGLGLFITYTLIEEHNGRIEVSSKQGYGTEISINLPLFNLPL